MTVRSATESEATHHWVGFAGGVILASLVWIFAVLTFGTARTENLMATAAIETHRGVYKVSDLNEGFYTIEIPDYDQKWLVKWEWVRGRAEILDK